MRLGEQVLGRYALEEKVGEGANGTVYRATDETLGRVVAVKVMHRATAADRHAWARWEQEGRAAAALDGHPSIVRMLDGGVHDGLYVAVMGFVEGRTLEAMAREARPTPGEVARLVLELADALQFAHERGLVHRDVKPSNVIVEGSGRPVLVDFGLAASFQIDPEVARSLGSLEARLVGTPQYMAPEQVRCAPATPASDQWALAVTAYELLTGRSPWRASEATRLFAEILLDEPEPITVHRPDLGADVWAVLSRAFEKEPTDRYPDVRRFATDLASSLLERTSRTPLAMWRRIRRRRRGPAIAAAGLVALLALVTLAALAAPTILAPHPFDDPDSVIACPILDAEGVDPPTTWLGAAAADLACRRVAWTLAGDRERTRLPAALLGLPPLPSDDLTATPYATEGERARSREAAAAFPARITGRVETRGPDAFSVHLVLEAGGLRRWEADGEGPALYAAVSAAVRALLAAADDAAWTPSAHARAHGFDRRTDGIDFEDLQNAVTTGVDVTTRCRRWQARPGGAPFGVSEWLPLCARWFERLETAWSPPALAPPPPPYRLLWDAAGGGCDGPPEGCSARLRAFADGARDPRVRALALRSAAMLAEVGGDQGEQTALLREALRLWPRDTQARENLLSERASASDAVRATLAFVAWSPGARAAWGLLAGMKTERPVLERHYLVASGHPQTGLQLGTFLLEHGQQQAALDVASRYRAGAPWEKTTGVYLQARVAVERGRLLDAFDALQGELLALDRLGGLRFADTASIGLFLDLVDLVEPGTAPADALVRHFVLSEPPRVAVPRFARLPLLSLLLRASPEEARRALPVLAAMRDGVDFPQEEACLEGVARWLDGDEAAAAAAFRRALVGQPLAQIFGAGGVSCDVPLAVLVRLELVALEAVPTNLAAQLERDIRAALDTPCADARARDALRALLDRLRTFDVEVPSVDRLRAHLAACPPT